MTKRRNHDTEKILPSGQVADPGPDPEPGRAIRPEPDIDDPPPTAAAPAGGFLPLAEFVKTSVRLVRADGETRYHPQPEPRPATVVSGGMTFARADELDEEGFTVYRQVDPAAVDAGTLTDEELDARIAADVVDADAEIAAADAAALATAPPDGVASGTVDPHVSLSPASHVRLYLKDLRAKNGALVRAATAIHHPHVGVFPRMLTVSLSPGVSVMFERAGQDADGFETYRQPDF